MEMAQLNLTHYFKIWFTEEVSNPGLLHSMRRRITATSPQAIGSYKCSCSNLVSGVFVSNLQGKSHKNEAAFFSSSLQLNEL